MVSGDTNSIQYQQQTTYVQRQVILAQQQAAQQAALDLTQSSQKNRGSESVKQVVSDIGDNSISDQQFVQRYGVARKDMAAFIAANEHTKAYTESRKRSADPVSSVSADNTSSPRTQDEKEIFADLAVKAYSEVVKGVGSQNVRDVQIAVRKSWEDPARYSVDAKVFLKDGTTRQLRLPNISSDGKVRGETRGNLSGMEVSEFSAGNVGVKFIHPLRGEHITRARRNAENFAATLQVNSDVSVSIECPASPDEPVSFNVAVKGKEISGSFTDNINADANEVRDQIDKVLSGDLPSGTQQIDVESSDVSEATGQEGDRKATITYRDQNGRNIGSYSYVFNEQDSFEEIAAKSKDAYDGQIVDASRNAPFSAGSLTAYKPPIQSAKAKVDNYGAVSGTDSTGLIDYRTFMVAMQNTGGLTDAMLSVIRNAEEESDELEELSVERNAEKRRTQKDIDARNYEEKKVEVASAISAIKRHAANA